jgi:hypothetical protein
MNRGSYYHFSYICILAILCAPGCLRRSTIRFRNLIITSPSTSIDLQKVHEHPAITIWVHGTRFIRQRLFDQVFHSKPGLKRAIDISPQYYANQIAHVLHRQSPEMFPLETFYAFTWEGGLSHYERLKAAQELYRQLITLIGEYEKRYGSYPVIRFITHSHGGNVALNLAFVDQVEQKHLIIEQLFLMACPVQANTKFYASHPLFKRVYSVSSSLDLIQVMAPQNFNETLPFSDRDFPQFSNLVQAHVRINRHAVFHTEFTSRLFLSSIPKIIEMLDEFKDSGVNLHKKRIILNIKNQQRIPKRLFKRYQAPEQPQQ